MDVCAAFREKGYESPMMGFTNEETTSLYTLMIYPYFCGTVAEDAEAVQKLNAMDPAAGAYMRPALRRRRRQAAAAEPSQAAPLLYLRLQG